MERIGQDFQRRKLQAADDQRDGLLGETRPQTCTMHSLPGRATGVKMVA